MFLMKCSAMHTNDKLIIYIYIIASIIINLTTYLPAIMFLDRIEI